MNCCHLVFGNNGFFVGKHFSQIESSRVGEIKLLTVNIHETLNFLEAQKKTFFVDADS